MKPQIHLLKQNAGRSILALSLAFGCMLSAHAQEKVTVTGTVMDETGDPVPGVAVIIKGTTSGTVTALDGKYSIPAESGELLEFNCLGFQPAERTVPDKRETAVINIRLIENATMLDDVVVVGYGEQKKGNLTGSISSIKSDDIATTKSASLAVAMAGKVPGLQIKQQTGMLVSTEVATPQHVRQALDYGLDFIWIGARTTSNPFAVQEIADSLAGHDIPVLVKNPISPDIALWTGAIERLYNAGIKRLGAIHRGFTSYNRHLYRNTPYWEIPIELKMQMPQLTMICDPSHIGGKRELVADLCIQAMELRFNGLIIESHINPDEAWSDAGQQITPDELKYIISHITEKNSKTVDKDINSLRTQIDECDEALVELLAKRMQLAKEIGAFKKHNNMSVLQQDRYNEILKKRMTQAENLSLDKDFIKKIFQTIHTASVNEQIKLK